MHLGFVLFTLATVISGTLSNHTRTKRMYGMCPPNFYRIGSACYYISPDRVNWLDAHFECRDKNSKLAEPGKLTDRQLRKYLMASDKADPGDIWIGGTYEWNKHKWEWGYSGNEIKYQSFSQMDPGQDLKYHCAVLSPELQYRWSARSCVDKHRYICQHKMPKVSAKNREKVYTRWNETFPNQMANEVLLNVVDSWDNNPRRETIYTYKNVTYLVSCKIRPLSTRRKKIGADSNQTLLERRRPPSKRRPQNDPTISPFNVNDFTATASMPNNDINSKPDSRKWNAQQNIQNNETIDRPSRRRTTFDKIAERKRQKELKRKRRIQQRRRQQKIQREKELAAAAEAERQRKIEEEALKNQAKDEMMFPMITEVLHIPNIMPQEKITSTEKSTTTTTTARREISDDIELEKEFIPAIKHQKNVEPTSTTTTMKPEETTPKPIEQEKPQKFNVEQSSSPNSEIPDTGTQLYNEYMQKLEARRKEEEKRIEEEKRKRDELEKSRQEEILRLENLMEDQKKEEERLAQELKEREAEAEKIKAEEERIRKEKEAKLKEEEARALFKKNQRIEVLRLLKEKIKKEKEEKMRKAMENKIIENENETEDGEPTDRQITAEEKRLRLQKLRERLEKLTPEQRQKFHELRMKRKRMKQKRHSSANHHETLPALEQ